MRTVALTIIAILIFMSCKPVHNSSVNQSKTAVVAINSLKEYNGTWYGSDYSEITDEQGNKVVMGSCLTFDIREQSCKLDLVYAGAPPISRIAEVITVFSLQDSITGVFKFDDGWENKGTGRIRFEGTSVSVDIKIEEWANTDMQIFEGEVMFLRKASSDMSEDNGKFEITGNNIFLTVKGEKRKIDELATSDEFPFGLSPTFAFSSDSALLAYISGTGAHPALVIADRAGVKETIVFSETFDGRTTLDWSGDGGNLVFNAVNKIWIMDTRANIPKFLTSPPEGEEDIRPSFKVNGKIKLFRGSRFEYSFSGREYEVDPDGNGCRVVENGRVIKGEELR